MVATRQDELVYCAREGTDGNHAAFLEVHRQGRRVRVQRTALGKDKLNRFWTEWLRLLILKKTDSSYGLSVEISGNVVLIGGSMTDTGLVETVRSLAAQIFPIKQPVLHRSPARDDRGGYVWVFSPDRMGFIEAELEDVIRCLPRGTSLWLQFDELRLITNHPMLKTREIALMVETQFELRALSITA